MQIVATENVQPVQPAAPGVSAIEQAAQDALSRIAAGQAVAPAAEVATDVDPGDEAPAATPADAPAPEGEPETEAEAEAEPEAEGEAEPPERVITLKATADGEHDLEIPVEDIETYERLERLVREHNVAKAQLAGLEKREQQYTRQVDELEEIQAVLQTDPVGGILNMLPSSPELVVRLTRELLLTPQVWEQLQPEIEHWSDEDARQVAAAQAMQQRAAFMQDAEQERAVVRNYQQIRREIAKLVPPALDEDQHRRFWRDAQLDLRDYAAEKGLVILPPDQVASVLQDRIRLYVTAASGQTEPSEPAPPPQPKPVAKPVAGKRGSQYVTEENRRKAMAASGARSTGHTGPAPTQAPPPNMSIEEAVKWHAEQMAKGRRMVAAMNR